MSEKNNPEKTAEQFFATLKYRDVEKLRKWFNFFIILTSFFMFFITISSLGFAFVIAMKPTPVIAFDKEGRKLAFSGNDTVQNESSSVRVSRFMSDFIRKFEGVSPNIEEDLTEAYNMLTPKFRQILLDRSVHKEKIEAWKNKNFETKFKLLKLKFLNGSLSAGSTLTVEGVGEMSFKNVIDYSNEGIQRKDFVYFTALLIVTPVSFEISQDGLLVDFYKGSTLGDFRSLRAYLLENKKEYLIDKDSEEVLE